MMRKRLIFFIIFLFCFLGGIQSARADDLIVVATPLALQSAQDWMDFLSKNKVPIKTVRPKDFVSERSSKYIVLMGGMDEPGGIKDLVKEVVGPEETAWLMKRGSRDMYLKADVWKDGQTVIVFAGWRLDAANEARRSEKEKWFEQISSWFNIKVSPSELYGY